MLGNAHSGVLLHEALGHGLEADYIRLGASIYATMMGQTFASDHCNIVDDGSLPNLRGSINVDDEGIQPQPTMLVEKGKLVGYLTDRISSRQLGRAPPATVGGKAIAMCRCPG